jgi:hypothetical protein
MAYYVGARDVVDKLVKHKGVKEISTNGVITTK